MDLVVFYQELIHKPFCQYTLIDSFAVLMVFVVAMLLWGIINMRP